MQAALADLLHDTAVLHRFADFIEEYCEEQERSQRYIDASGAFFRYAEKLARGIKQKHCRQVERAIRRGTLRIGVLRTNVLTLKSYLRLLHTFIKPAADAHTLSIPAPLIELASLQLQQVKGMRGSSVVALLTPHLMYFQRPHTDLKNQAAQAQTIIPQAIFPRKLGFIELPYSQGPGFFKNLAIYHEMGHFVYEELSATPRFKSAFGAIASAQRRSLDTVYRSAKDAKPRALAGRILESWTQEIFCDLLAVRLIGPAFSFALVEILELLGLLSPEERIKFNQEHPAPACRFAEQVNLLQKDGWWEAIASIEPSQKKLIGSLASVPQSDYLDEGPEGLMQPFLELIVPTVRKLVLRITKKPSESVDWFTQNRGDIEDCLRAGVIPHVRGNRTPDTTSIINIAFSFYLTSLSTLIAKFEKPTAQNDVEKHSVWTERIENWTRKAIEDAQIQARFKGVQ
jgi:hypothetical protein